MFPCSGCHTRQASEGSCNNSGKSPTVSAPAPQAALRARARTWLGAVLFPSCALASFQMFHAAAHGVLSGSVLLDLLSGSFLSLCFSLTGYRSFIEKKLRLSHHLRNPLTRVPFLEDPWKCFVQAQRESGDSWIPYQMFLLPVAALTAFSISHSDFIRPVPHTPKALGSGGLGSSGDQGRQNRINSLLNTDYACLLDLTNPEAGDISAPFLDAKPRLGEAG